MILGIDASQANREKRTGTEWYAFYLIDEFKKILADKDIEVRLYFRGEPREDLVKNLPTNFEIKKLGWFLPRLWVQGRLSLEMLVSPPDILFCPAHTIPLIHPKKTFTTLADIGFEDNPELYDKLSLLYHQFSAWWAVREAWHIFVPSNFTKKRVMEVYKCPEEKISVIYLGIDKNKFQIPNDKSQINSKFEILNSKFYILFVGRLGPKKNILNMIKAYEMASVDMPLVLAGRKVNIDDVDDYLKNKPELKAKIRFLGYIKEEEKQVLYQNASVFLFPTLYEGFGIPILEAQAAGTPVITSNRTSNPEVAGKGALIVDPESPDKIAEAIKKILDNQNLSRDVVEAGLENVKKFNWEQTAVKTLNKIFS